MTGNDDRHEGEEEYEPPEVVVLGRVDEHTLGGGAVGNDAFEASATPVPF